MGVEQPVRWYERFVREWVDRFGFLANHNEPDSVEAIDEVACLLTEQHDAKQRRIDDLERTLKQCRPIVARSGASTLLDSIDQLLQP